MRPISISKAKLKKIRIQFQQVSGLILLIEELLVDLKKKQDELNKESLKLLKKIEGE